MVVVELAHRDRQRAALAGGTQPGIHLVKPAQALRRLVLVMIRCPSSLKKCWFDVLRADHWPKSKAVWPSAS